MSLKVFYITNNPDVALIADVCGVDVIWIDLETIGKEERQKNMNSVKSKHSIEDIYKIKPLLKNAELMVRINPINDNSITEINEVIKAGADIIMLPMWKNIDEVKKFIGYVDYRTKTSLLLETKEAVECIDEILNLNFDEIHIGLNDLHLSYGLTFMFELLSNGIVEMLCSKFESHNIVYGFGGIAQLGYGLLPAENIITEHYRLGSTRAILSRSFCDYAKYEDFKQFSIDFKSRMLNFRDFESKVSAMKTEDLINNKIILDEIVKEIINQRKESLNGN